MKDQTIDMQEELEDTKGVNRRRRRILTSVLIRIIFYAMLAG